MDILVLNRGDQRKVFSQYIKLQINQKENILGVLSLYMHQNLG